MSWLDGVKGDVNWALISLDLVQLLRMFVVFIDYNYNCSYNCVASTSQVSMIG